MTGNELKSIQAPLKQRYRDDPRAGIVTLRATGTLTDNVACRIDTGRAVVEAGLHPATGGTGQQACSGDMLLQALVACAGVTLNAVATSIGISLRAANLTAEGQLDFRGTLGVARDVPVGFTAIRLLVALETDAPLDQQQKLLELTERYCVVYQTLRHGPSLETRLLASDSDGSPLPAN